MIHGFHPLTRLIIRSEHLRLLRTGPTLVLIESSFSHTGWTQGCTVCVTSACVTCGRVTAKLQMGQHPAEQTTPDLVFDRVGVDYAGPLQLKLGSTCKHVLVKSYVWVFVLLSIRGVHLELISDLSTDAFIACLQRFVSRRGKPTLI